MGESLPETIIFENNRPIEELAASNFHIFACIGEYLLQCNIDIRVGHMDQAGMEELKDDVEDS